MKHLRLRLHPFRQLVETEDVDSEDGVDGLQTRLSKETSMNRRRRPVAGLTMTPKENISEALLMRIPACASGLRHMILPTCVPVMA